MSNPVTDTISEFFNGLFPGSGSIISDLTNAPSAVQNWFKSLAGQLASAFETGFLALIKDIWDVVVGPVEILAGALIVVIALGIAFKNDVAGLAPVFAAAML